MRRIRFDSSQSLLHAQGPLLGLIAAIFGVFVLQKLKGMEWASCFMVVPGAVVDCWERLLAGNLGAAELKEFGTLISYAFLHGNVEHLINNMLFLWIFAALAAELVGHVRMFAIFAITSITGAIVHVALNADSGVPMLGASGAVLGFEGFYFGLAMRWRLPDPHVWPMARPIPPGHLALLGGAGVAIDYFSLLSGSESNVAFGAHIGGFLGGALIAMFLPTRPRGARHR